MERHRQLCFARGVCVERDRLAWWARECAHLSKLQAVGSLTLQRGRRPHPHTHTQGLSCLASHVTDNLTAGYCEEEDAIWFKGGKRRRQRQRQPLEVRGFSDTLLPYCVFKLSWRLPSYFMYWVGTMTATEMKTRPQFFFIFGKLPLVISPPSLPPDVTHPCAPKQGRFQKSNWCMPLCAHIVLTSMIHN